MTLSINKNPGNDTVNVHKHESCPFRRDHPAGYWCGHPWGKSMDCEDELPNACPLLRAPCYVKLGPSLQSVGARNVQARVNGEVYGTVDLKITHPKIDDTVMFRSSTREEAWKEALIVGVDWDDEVLTQVLLELI